MTNESLTRRPPDALPIAVRAYALRTDAAAPSPPSRRRSKPRARTGACWPASVLVFDTETTIDAAQALTVGSYRFCQWTEAGALTCLEEGLFHADDLPETDPTGWAVLQAYANSRVADVGPEGSPTLRLRSRREFVDEVLWRAAYKARALVVGFNLPFDLSRLAVAHGEARGTFRGGFSFVLWEYRDRRTGEFRENRYRPRVCVKSIDSKRAFIGFSRPRDADAGDQAPEAGGRTERELYTFRGNFLDLRTLAFALTSRGHSLASACEAFRVTHGKGQTEEHGRITPAYLDYNRRDVLATQELLQALRAEFDRHPVDLDPCKAFSPAAVAKAYLRAMGLTPPAEKFSSVPREVLGIAMAAYYGGRAECRIRCTPVPVVYCDFLSMYPTVNTLMGLWRLLTAERLEVVEATAEVQQLLERVTVDGCFEPALWRELRFFAEVQPDGDTLPVRAQYSESSDAYNIGVNPLTSSVPMWYAGPDVVASTLLTGKPPRVRRAIKLVPHGSQAGLTQVALRGAVPIDPAAGDFFRSVIEERARVKADPDRSADDREQLQGFLKVLANSGSYGVFAEMNREELRAGERANVSVYGLGEPFTCRTTAPEDPGAFCFPPLAALIPAAARLMLALLERCVTDAGGAYAFCDTDSMAIVATRTGGATACDGGMYRLRDGRAAVQALTWDDVAGIVTRFALLNPYDQAAVSGSLLKVETENFQAGGRVQLWCYMVSAKRYALFRRCAAGLLRVTKASEHGLGYLLNPADPNNPSREWINAAWRFLIARALGERGEAPIWSRRPAVSRVSISHITLLNPFQKKGDATPYQSRVKPFNFLLSAHVARLGHPIDVDPRRFHLVAPFDSDAQRWLQMRWTDRHSRRQYRVTTRPNAEPHQARLKSLSDVLNEHGTHVEAKSRSAATAGTEATSEGLLQRRHVTPSAISHIGKESNDYERVELQLVHDQSDVVHHYRCSTDEVWERHVLPVLLRTPRSVLAQVAGITPRSVSALRNGRTNPCANVRSRLTEYAYSVLDRTIKPRSIGPT